MIVAVIQGAMVLFLYVLGALVVGFALVPSIALFLKLLADTALYDIQTRAVVLGLGMAVGYFLFGITLLLLVGLLNIALNLRLKEGVYGIKDTETLKWFFVNALVQGVKAFFMDFMLLTPFASLFYRMMGAKLGQNVQINSKNVADISLLEIGDHSVIGGNATVIGHVFERRGLRLKKVKIGANVVIGLNSVVMPGVEIGDNAIVAAGAIVPKDTVIPPRTVYIGPAQRRERDKRDEEETS